MFILAHAFRGLAIMVGSPWWGSSSHITASSEAESETISSQRTPGAPPPHDLLPPTRHQILKFPQPSPIPITCCEQALNAGPCGWHFIFNTQQRVLSIFTHWPQYPKIPTAFTCLLMSYSLYGTNTSHITLGSSEKPTTWWLKGDVQRFLLHRWAASQWG